MKITKTNSQLTTLLRPKPLQFLTLCLALCLGSISATRAAHISVIIENLAPMDGNYLTPVFTSFHDGSFDLFDPGSAVSAGLERLVEDGDTSFLSGEFLASGAGTVHATLIGNGAIPPLAPGDHAAMTFSLDPNDPSNHYFSFATMIIPSNDAFIGNNNPVAFEVFDAGGNFRSNTFTVAGAMVWDAGTEVNDELPANTAFFGQAAPNTGVPEGGIAHLHDGFNAPGNGGILDDTMFAGADFTAPGYPVARVTIQLADSDIDGVPDDNDLCPDTAPGAAVDSTGCSIAQLVPCLGPEPGRSWKSHGQYVSTIAKVAREFRREGLITQREAALIVIEAAHSDCGQKHPGKVKSKKKSKEKSKKEKSKKRFSRAGLR